METAVVGIASVDSKPINTKRGPSTVYTITDDFGIEYTTFDKDVAATAAVRKGRSVLLSFNVRENTKPNRDNILVTYTNRYLESVEDSAEDIGPVDPKTFERAPESPVSQPQLFTPHSEKDGSIARAVALKAAVEVVASGVVTSKDESTITGADVLLLAKFFEPYLLGHIDAPTETSVTNDVEDLPF